MKKKKTIRLVLDCDGILADFVGGALRFYRNLTGNNVDVETIKGWCITSSLAFRDEEQKEIFNGALRAPGFAMSLEPMPGSKEAVKKLREMVELHIVTAPLTGSATWTYEREVWLAMHYDIPNTRVHHSQSKYIYSADLFIDDKPDNVREWAERNPAGVAFLWDNLQNRADKDLERLCSWADLFDRFNGRHRS